MTSINIRDLHTRLSQGWYYISGHASGEKLWCAMFNLGDMIRSFDLPESQRAFYWLLVPSQLILNNGSKAAIILLVHSDSAQAKVRLLNASLKIELSKIEISQLGDRRHSSWLESTNIWQRCMHRVRNSIIRLCFEHCYYFIQKIVINRSVIKATTLPHSEFCILYFTFISWYSVFISWV